MTSDLRMINLIFESAGIVLSLTGLIQAISGQFIKKRTKGFFIAFFGVLSAYALCYLVREVTYDKVGWDLSSCPVSYSFPRHFFRAF